MTIKYSASDKTSINEEELYNDRKASLVEELLVFEYSTGRQGSTRSLLFRRHFLLPFGKVMGTKIKMELNEF